MPEPRTYSPEEIVGDCNVIKAIWEVTKYHLYDKGRVLVAYATCRALADLIEIKVDHLKSLDGGPIWPEGTDRGYFLEKVHAAIEFFGALTEKVLSGSYEERDLLLAESCFYKFKEAFPNFAAAYGPFVRE